MILIKKILFVLLFFVTIGCIEPFTLNIDDYQKVLVIDGFISDENGYQSVKIGRSAFVSEENKYFPEKQCQVNVRDDKGNSFNFEEYTSGNYRCLIGKEYLTIGTRFKIYIKTQDGREYESDFDELLACPPIDKIYYEVQKHDTYDPINPEYGIQFFVETNVTGNYADNYRWNHIETWEYHSKYPLEYYFDGAIKRWKFRSDSMFYCWKTESVKEIFTMTTKRYSTKNIVVPIRFVSNQTNRLKFGYSLLVKQYSLCDAAFQYWYKMQQQLQETGGLYEKQPMSIFGNIKCTTHPEEIVMGFFYASSMQEKRIFVNGNFNFDIYDFHCTPYMIESDQLYGFLMSLQEIDFPFWILKTDHG
ncbi:MAG: DUF4249 domain-containing protein, partial [Bacteroidales bacterium]|nr:DUF4249 domain-containing protein [Bacteroidales bacterium]